MSLRYARRPSHVMWQWHSLEPDYLNIDSSEIQMNLKKADAGSLKLEPCCLRFLFITSQALVAVQKPTCIKHTHSACWHGRLHDRPLWHLSRPESIFEGTPGSPLSLQQKGTDLESYQNYYDPSCTPTVEECLAILVS